MQHTLAMSRKDGVSDNANDRLKNLLEELRVMLPGVEILFAFLLTVPFSGRAEQITTEQRYVYYVAFLAAAAAVICLVAPGIQHRLDGDGADLEQLLRTATRLSIAGMFCLSVAITAVVFLVSDILFTTGIATAFAVIIAVLVVLLWFVMPLARKLRGSA